jgi:tetratricopeptide (TPR) repeat protein
MANKLGQRSTEAYRQAVKLAPGSAIYRETLARWLAALAYRKQGAGQDEAAAGLYREALDLDGQNVRDWFNLGIACVRLGRRAAAIDAYEKAAALAPDDARFRSALEAARRAGEER